MLEALGICCQGPHVFPDPIVRTLDSPVAQAVQAFTTRAWGLVVYALPMGTAAIFDAPR